ncbi:MAG: N-(5phosphoribosyl)anthranilate isomerase [Phycisphaerales bacterium]|nr:N-(5phosphoribosyl)anthranilate isomerase [Phycisphaerales bacterium]
MSRTRIKICCIANEAEAALAVSAGADVLGLVSAMPSGPGAIEEAIIGRVAKRTPPGVSSFLLTSLVNADELIAQHRRCRTTSLQLVDWIPVSAYEKLRKELPGISLVQVIHVRNHDSLDDAIAAAEHVDAILLDSGNTSLAVKELGGTGRVHDWGISRRIVESVSIPVYLAGGLNAGNVGEAIAKVKPFGVDICSGVRTNGKLDAQKLRAFVAAVDAAGRAA